MNNLKTGIEEIDKLLEGGMKKESFLDFQGVENCTGLSLEEMATKLKEITKDMPPPDFKGILELLKQDKEKKPCKRITQDSLPKEVLYRLNGLVLYGEVIKDTGRDDSPRIIYKTHKFIEFRNDIKTEAHMQANEHYKNKKEELLQDKESGAFYIETQMLIFHLKGKILEITD